MVMCGFLRVQERIDLENERMPLEWGYNQENGPEKWPHTYPEAAGTRQSPIDIKPVDLKTLNSNRKLSWKYIPEHTNEVSNPGYCWKVSVDGRGSELSGGPLEGTYVLEQFHCHWGKTNNEGSEHTINGKKFAGELHLVHWNSTKYSSFEAAAKHSDGLAVLGVFLKPGKKHMELDKIVNQLSKIQYRGESAKILVPINPGALLPEDSGYYTYQGSLTTPPCSECVIWIVFKEPVDISQEQLEAFRSLRCYSSEDICPCDEFKGFVKTNFRPTLPLGQREVKECRQ
ncbi:carbonic anhydrase 13 isoform X2 [Anthonomus grandis grandis]|uniref:carbonic anhydrase 13 isoform X2 n=1 Tax=Anthonomus grandis grandis TaxID=2921223 RepID=UPI0021660DC0|nr:carbonic anhydrase 13 isoform X2 [Anthonomus grandis grandis]